MCLCLRVRGLRVCLRRWREVATMPLFDKWRDYFSAPEPLAPGLYQYRTPPDAPRRYRLHLRVEPSGGGVLIVNASTVLHLNRTATEHAKLMVDQVPVETAARIIARRYRVATEIAAADAIRLREAVERLVGEEDVCPVSYLDFERIEPFQAPSQAPYRVDLALTYCCDNDCSHCYVEHPRAMTELTTAEWRRTMEILWQAGVPHLCFTGGEATMREDLPDLVTYAEDIGFVTGLLTNGRRLSDRGYLDALVAAGLDHVQITLESANERVHNEMVGADAWVETVQGIRNAVPADLYVLTNTTLTRANIGAIEQTIDFIAGLGVGAFACNGIIYSGHGKDYELALPERELAGTLQRVTQAAERNGMRFIWYTPTEYCELNPLELELGAKSCTAARYNVCVEPNGDVIPCQSYFSPMGNILRDPWTAIWNHPLAQQLRERGQLPEKCVGCENAPLCGGGCPLHPTSPGPSQADG